MPELYSFQKKGVRFLASRRKAMLCDVMGLGKTVQAIRAVGQARAGRDHLVVCPASAVPNWRNEWAKWDGTGSPRFISYASLIRRNWKEWYPSTVILDEFHYCKSPSAQRTRAALGLARQCYKNGGRAWLLSGTPLPNDPTELWPPIKYLWPEIAAEVDCTRATQWRAKWCLCRPTPYGPKPYAVKNGSELRRILRRIMLRRTLDDVNLELPPLRVELSRLPKSKAAADALAEYERWEESDYTSTLRRLLGNVKAPIVTKQIISELDYGAYDKIVVMYHHRDVGQQLRESFLEAQYGVSGFGGDASQTEREKEIARFREGPSQVFVAQQTAAGIAVNLTAASEIVLLEPAWTPSKNEQALKRIHRIGQEHPCRVRIFALSGTIDEAIMGTIRNKMRMLKEVGL